MGRLLGERGGEGRRGRRSEGIEQGFVALCVHSVALVASCRGMVLEKVQVILAEVSMTCANIAARRTKIVNDGYQSI